MPVHRAIDPFVRVPRELVNDHRLDTHALGTLVRLLASGEAHVGEVTDDASLAALTRLGYVRWDGDLLMVADDPALLR